MKITQAPELVDYHCHLDLYPDYEQEFSECDSAKVATLAVTTTPKAWPRNKELAARSFHVRAALGLHPQLVDERAGELTLFEKLLPEARFVGEVGLDAGPRYYASFAEQKRVFHRILELCADAGDKILSVHSVRSSREVLNSIEQFLARSQSRAVLHWFTGSAADAKRAVDLGCYFSVNEQMLTNPSSRRVVAAIPAERILTETDGPFMRCEARPAKPGEVTRAVTILAELLNRPAPQTLELILDNLKALEGGLVGEPSYGRAGN
jgi:TatD DNase family protein